MAPSAIDNSPVSNGNGNGNGHGQSNGPTQSKIVIDEDHYLYQPKRLRLVGVGAGISGIILAYKAKHEMKMLDEYCDIQIYEVSLFELSGMNCEQETRADFITEDLGAGRYMEDVALPRRSL